MILGFHFLAQFQTGMPDWLLVTVLFGVTWGGVWALRPVVTFLHELGHAIPALIFTRQVVEVRVGNMDQEIMDAEARGGQDTNGARGEEDRKSAWSTLGRFHWACSFRGSFQGFTGYDRDSLGQGALLAVIAGGPLVSLLLCGFGGWLALEVAGDIWQRIAAIGFLCANLIVTLRSIVPVTLRNEASSDALDFWNTLRKRS